MKRTKQLMLLLLLPFVIGCNNTDDVLKIFTEKTWKLTKIVDANNTMVPFYNFWADNETARENSMMILSRSDTFVLTFTGAETNGTVSGSFSGKAASESIANAQWRANGDKRSFSTNLRTTDDSDILGQKFLEGLSKADEYRGDEHNLYLFYTDTSGRKCMFFVVQK